MPAERVREHVALVNQEHHVFVGSLRDNLLLARTSATDAELWSALAAVDADDWARALPDGLDTETGSGGLTLTPAQAQQIALARLVLADPHTLVLDEATSLLDPRAARHLEHSLARVLDGRTVVAIAHRLHTPRTTRTSSRWSRAAASRNWAATTRWSRRTARTRHCGAPGTGSREEEAGVALR
ncbi:hypothetical protein GCM10020367_07090 [Streptomyces sannanensis]|uniref:ABC transporter domain-containing protein n=1 Tax=Streptomyces sannanensis TaxID=285536 RepID=A0ABP6S5S4_9ACTN